MNNKNRSDQRTYHFIYKTTCSITNRFYVGMHSTNDLEDGYLGSGTLLSRSIKKHGKENHSFQILEFLLDRKSLRNREAEIINEELLSDSLCMNLILGGQGDFSYINSLPNQGLTNEQRSEIGKLGAKALLSNQITRDRFIKASRERALSKDRKWTTSNTCWVSNDLNKETKCIKSSELEDFLQRGWYKGRKYWNRSDVSGRHKKNHDEISS
jgi:hypothetical protein